MKELTDQLKSEARRLGFQLGGVTRAAAPPRLAQLHRWLDAGFAGQMHYLEKRRDAYAHPTHILDGCRSVLMLAMPYLTDAAQKNITDPQKTEGKVARYATGSNDYHDVIHEALKQLKRWLVARHPQTHVRGVVDTAPLLEREFAQLAGLGWIGKNTLLLNKQWGSYFFLAALLTDLDLAVDAPTTSAHCGTCTACLDACPTKAFVAPYVLDARKCISYLSIEHRGVVDPSLAKQFDHWAFGCDVCQEVCPWNRKARVGNEPSFAPTDGLDTLDIVATLLIDEPEFRRRYRKTPLWRSKRRGIVRNAALLAGTHRLRSAYAPLCQLLHDEEPILRAAAAWAIGRIQMNDWRGRLQTQLEREDDPIVKREITRALNGIDESGEIEDDPLNEQGLVQITSRTPPSSEMP